MSENDFIRHHLGGPPEPVARCSITNRPYEAGSGALPHEEQTALFVQEKAIQDDLPKPGERDPQTGRLYETSTLASGFHGASAFAQTKTAQSRRFLEELPDDIKAERQANANKLLAVEPKGRA
jgi:hypothetical protein